MHNRVLFRIERANGSIQTGESWNLRVNSGTNWQATHMGSGSIAPIQNIALTQDATSPSASDTSLAGELTTDGLSRTTGTYSHTADASTYTLSASWQYTGSSVVTVAKAAVAHDATRTQATQSTDTMFLETLVSPVAVLGSNDTLSIAWGITI